MLISLIVTLFLAIPPFDGEFCSTRDRDFKEYRYAQDIPICRRNVSTSRKNAICKRDGVDNRKEFKVDHIIPLSLGGDNSDRNLWCQHRSIDTANIEGYAYRMVQKGHWIQEEGLSFVRQYKFKLKD